MAYIANTFFEVKVSNIIYNATQNVSGTYQNSGDDPDICPSGLLVLPQSLLPNQGYTGVNNGNAWVFKAATSGAPKADNIQPELFAFNSYDANKVSNASGTNQWYVGAETAGLALPAGEIGTFTRIIPNEIYRFGAGNFQTAPSSLPTDCYCTISNGLLVASSSTFTAGQGWVFKVLGNAAESYTTGTMSGGTCYRVKAFYAPAGT